MNKKNSYALIDTETGKVIKYREEPQYFRLKQVAVIEKIRLQTELRIKIEIKKLNFKKLNLPKCRGKNAKTLPLS